MEHVKSTCLGCSLGCGVELIVRDNQLLRIDGDWNAPVNAGVLCEVGRFLPLAEDRQRIVTPLVRKNGSLKAATWEEAMAYVSAKLKPLAGKDGDGVAALASTRLPVEALHLFKQLFADKLGSGMVTSIEEGVTTALPGAVAQELGKPFEGSLEALKSADCVVAVGVDLVGSHQVAGFFVKRGLPTGTKLVVIDPYENGLHDLAHYPLQPQQGTDYDLLLGIMSAIVNMGLVKSIPDLRQHTPEIASQTTGIPAETIRNVARLIASSQSPVFVYGKGVTRGDSPRALKALLELASLVGAASLVGVKGQANSLAAYLVGLEKPFEVNGHRAIYLALVDDKPSKRLIKRLEGAPFIAVQASHVSPATAMADVVLPVEMWAEQAGHYLSLEGRLQEARRGLTPPADVRSHVAVLQSLAETLGVTLDADWQSGLRRRVSTNVIMK